MCCTARAPSASSSSAKDRESSSMRSALVGPGPFRVLANLGFELAFDLAKASVEVELVLALLLPEWTCTSVMGLRSPMKCWR